MPMGCYAASVGDIRPKHPSTLARGNKKVTGRFKIRRFACRGGSPARGGVVVWFCGVVVCVGHGDADDGAAHIWRKEVVNRPVPPAHAGTNSLLLNVLAERGALLSKLGMKRHRNVPHRVEAALIAFEECFLGILAHEPAEPALHGPLVGASQFLAESGVALLDQRAVALSHLLITI